MAQKKQGFVYGALILMLSNIIVKVAGALFKIPLSNIIGDTAMGFFSSAYSIYSMCFLISTAGLPVAISRMIAKAKAKGNNREVDSVYRISLLLFLIIGILGTGILFFASGQIAAFSQEPELKICIQAISPIMFFICLVSCIRGYFQGNQNMTPTAVSQVIESFANLGLGLTAGLFANRAGLSPSAVAACALGGVTLGVVISAIYMSFAKWVAERDKESGLIDAGSSRSMKDLAKELISIAIPITISSSVLSLTSVIDSMLAVGTLNEFCVGVSYFDIDPVHPVAISLYGAYMAKAVTLFNLPPTIIYPFAISILPAISSADAMQDKAGLKRTMDFTFRIVSVICLPATIGLGVMAKPIIDLLFSSEAIYQTADGIAQYSNPVVAPMLTILSIAIVFSGLISVSGAMLQAYGYEKKSIISTCCGVLCKALTVLILLRIPSIGHYGIPLSTLLCYVIMFLFNFYFLSRYVNYRFSFRRILLKPLLSAILCGITAMVSYLILKEFFSSSLATIIGICLAALVYLISLLKSGGFTEEDILMLPGGKRIHGIFSKLKLLKSEIK